MAQFLRPASTVSAGNWSGNVSGSSLHLDIDETSYNDSDYIYVSYSYPQNTCEIALDSGIDPLSSSNHTIRVRVKYAVSGGSQIDNGSIKLFCGSTEIATIGTFSGLTSFTTIEYTLSSAEADAITDYTDLRIKITSGILTGTGGWYVSWSESDLPYPDVGVTADAATITLSGEATLLIAKDINIDADPGTLTLSGLATLAMLHDINIDADPGTLTLSGGASALVAKDINIDADAGTITLSGEATLLIAKDINIDADPGILTLSGLATCYNIPKRLTKYKPRYLIKIDLGTDKRISTEDIFVDET